MFIDTERALSKINPQNFYDKKRDIEDMTVYTVILMASDGFIHCTDVQNKVAQLLSVIATYGDRGPMLNLGILLYFGIGTPENKDFGHQWLHEQE
jgi:hypothetical protein